MGIYILLGVLVLIIFIVIGTYNGLASLKVNVEEGFSTMDVYLKKRYDLIPNLVETVKGYDKHEASTLTAVIEARNKAVSASAPSDVIAANGALTQGLSKMFALAEAYPDLKADKNYANLMSSLGSIEEDIENARKYYNGNVKIFNKKIVVFPTVLFAGMLGFTKFPFFEAAASERENVKVSF